MDRFDTPRVVADEAADCRFRLVSPPLRGTGRMDEALLCFSACERAASWATPRTPTLEVTAGARRTLPLPRMRCKARSTASRHPGAMSGCRFLSCADATALRVSRAGAAVRSAWRRGRTWSDSW